MKTETKFKNDVLAAIHDSATALRSVDAIDKATLNEFDKACLVTMTNSSEQQDQKIKVKTGLPQPDSQSGTVQGPNSLNKPDI